MTRPTSSNYVTRTEFEQAMDHIDATFVTKSEFERAMERIDARFDILQARLETSIERSTVTSIRWSVGIALSQYALIVGVILFFIARELPHG